MCGASDQHQQISDEQADFYKQMQQQDATTFAQNQNILKQVQSVYSPILAAGPNQNGFSDAETNDLNTQASEGVATDYASAARAMRENSAAAGGGNDYLPSGVEAQQEAGLMASAAQQTATQKQQIKQAGYAQGYDEFKTATEALDGVAGQLNPNAYASSANTAGSAASQTAEQIDQENDSWYAPLMGAVGAVGGGFLGGLAKKP